MARTSSLNCLSCRSPHQTPLSLNPSPLFTEKPFFFTEKCFVGSPAQKSAPIDRVPPGVGLAPSAAWRAPPLHLLAPWDPYPPPAWAAPPRALQKEPSGVGGRGKERAGSEGVWLEGRVLQLQWGMWGDPPNTSWGQTHICQKPRERPHSK